MTLLQAEQLEVQLIQMAMSGQLQKQIGEAELILMLESATQNKQKKITIKRHGFADEDDDDNDDDLM